MKLNKIENIIKENIKNYYGNAIEGNGTETTYFNDITYKHKYTAIWGLDEVSNKNLSDNEIFNYLFFKKKVGFSYTSRTIHLVLNEDWSISELKTFLDKTINNDTLITAINNKDLTLNFNSLQEQHCFKGSEIGTESYKLEMNKHKVFKEMLEKSLTEIGIDVNVCNFDVFM